MVMYMDKDLYVECCCLKCVCVCNDGHDCVCSENHCTFEVYIYKEVVHVNTNSCVCVNLRTPLF